MKQILSVLTTVVWLLATLVVFALKCFGVLDISWWWATIGVWAPVFVLVCMMTLVGATMTLVNVMNMSNAGLSTLNAKKEDDGKE